MMKLKLFVAQVLTLLGIASFAVLMLFLYVTRARADTPSAFLNIDGVVRGIDGADCPGASSVAVGPTNVVVVAEKKYVVFSKAGVRATGAWDIVYNIDDVVMASTTYCKHSGQGVQYPQVMYDRQADRWWIVATSNGTHKYECIAVSQTNDPTGAWYAYEFEDNGASRLTFSVWNDYLYAFDSGNRGVIAYDRPKMLAGNPAAGRIAKYPNFFNPYLCSVFAQPVRPLGYGPETSQPIMFAFVHHQSDDCNTSSSAIFLWEFVPNFITPSLSTWTAAPGSPITVAAFNWPGNPSQTYQLSWFKPTAPVYYRHLPGQYESLITTYNIAGSTSADAVHWAELRRSAVGQDWTLYAEGTYPTDATSRYVPAVATDIFGDISVGYTCAPVFPGVCYSGKTPSDLNLQTERVAATGITTACNECDGIPTWGYSGMAIDPVDDCTFWASVEYCPESTYHIRLVAFRFPACSQGGGGAASVPTPADCCDGRAAPTPFPCLNGDNGYCPPGASRTDHAICACQN